MKYKSFLISLALILGLLTGCWMESEFVRNCIGVGMMACGVLILQRK